jgi:hypothetical protein
MPSVHFPTKTRNSVTQTQTRSATQTNSFARLLYVTRKVQADLLAIVDTYGCYSEDYAIKLIKDFRVFLDEEVVDRVVFYWTTAGQSEVLYAYSYTVIGGDALADDRSGGIRYRADLEEAPFSVRVFYAARWRQLLEADKQAIRDRLSLTWGSAGQLNFSGGRWEADRTYSSGGVGLVRERFVR